VAGRAEADSANPRPSPELAVAAKETPHLLLRVAMLLAAALSDDLIPSLGMEQETASVEADLRCPYHAVIRGSLGRWVAVVLPLP